MRRREDILGKNKKNFNERNLRGPFQVHPQRRVVDFIDTFHSDHWTCLAVSDLSTIEQRRSNDGEELTDLGRGAW